MILESNDTTCILRLDGDCTLTSAAELKSALIQALTGNKALCVDCNGAGEVDITALQLLWAAEQAARSGERSLVSRVPEAMQGFARDAGFERFPGEADEG